MILSDFEYKILMLYFNQLILKHFENFVKNSFFQVLLKEYGKYIDNSLINNEIEQINLKVKNNEYTSIKEYYNDFYYFMNNISKITGKNSKIGLIIQTLIQIFEESLHINKNNKSTEYFAEFLKTFRQNIPNNLDELKNYSERQMPSNPVSIDYINELNMSQEQLFSLYSELESKDEEVVNRIGNLVSLYGLMKTKRKSFYADIKDLSPFTLRIIRNNLSNNIIRY